MKELEKVEKYTEFSDMRQPINYEDNYEKVHDVNGLTVIKKKPIFGRCEPIKCTPEVMATCYYARSAKNVGVHCDFSGITGTTKLSLGVKSDACTLYVKADERPSWNFNGCNTPVDKVGRKKCGNC